MKKGLVSIIVPIYNVQNYLEYCIKSIVKQTYTNLEIILVDDGSTDACPDICDNWREKDHRIKVIHKVNEGLGMARNTGIENATGEYLVFVDSDDYIDELMVEEVYKIQKNNNSDIVCFGFYSVNKDNKVISQIIPNPEKLVYEGIDVSEQFLPNLVCADLGKGINWNLNMSACMAMFRHELIYEIGWRFVSEREIISEDMYSLLSLYKNVFRVAVLPKAFYYYRENPSSLTRTYRKDRFAKVKNCYLESIKLCEKLKYNSCIKDRVACLFVSNVIVVLKQISVSNEDFLTKLKEIRRILNDLILQNVLKNKEMKKEPISRWILLKSMRYKYVHAIYIMCLLKNETVKLRRK